MADETNTQSTQETEMPAKLVEVPEVAGSWYNPNTHAYISRVIDQREHNLFLEEYYSSTDVKIYFDDIEQTEIGYIQYSVQEQLKPIYGYASNTWDDVAVGNRIVTGTLKVAVRNMDVRKYGEELVNPSINDFISFKPSDSFNLDTFNEAEEEALAEQDWIDTSTPGGSATTGSMSIGDLRKEEYEEANKKLNETINNKNNHMPLGDLIKGYYDSLTEEEEKKLTSAIDRTVGDSYEDKGDQTPWGLIIQNYYNNLTEEEEKKLKDTTTQVIGESKKDENNQMSLGLLMQNYYDGLSEQEKKNLTSTIDQTVDKSKENENQDEIPPVLAEPNDNTIVPIQQYIKDIAIDLRYATTNNFTNQVVYQNINEPLLRYGTVKKLKAAQDYLIRKYGLKLKIWDAYRPHSAQWALWEKSGKDPAFVADPSKGYSNHTRGCTVDVTLVDLNGNEVEMPTDFDDFSDKANAYFNGPSLSLEVQNNRQRLQEAMTNSGFKIYDGEWWHFTDTDVGNYPPVDDTQSK